MARKRTALQRAADDVGGVNLWLNGERPSEYGCELIARAAIGAIREPREVMMAAAHAKHSNEKITDADRVFYRWIWRAMIDEVLTVPERVKRAHELSTPARNSPIKE